MDYATLEDLSTYMKKPVGALPADSDRLISRASELMDLSISTVGFVDENTDATILATLNKATLAQVEYWMINGEDIDIGGSPDSFAIGTFSANYTSKGGLPVLAPRAKRWLFRGGLLNRSVRMSSPRSTLATKFFGDFGGRC